MPGFDAGDEFYDGPTAEELDEIERVLQGEDCIYDDDDGMEGRRDDDPDEDELLEALRAVRIDPHHAHADAGYTEWDADPVEYYDWGTLDDADPVDYYNWETLEDSGHRPKPVVKF